MLGARPPKADENVFELFRKGARTYSFDKCVLFDPNVIEEIGYQPGAHVCEPTGRVVVFRRPGLSLLHFKHLGVDYVRQRYESCAARCSDFNQEMHFSTHYMESKQTTLKRFDFLQQRAEEVFSGEVMPLDIPDNLAEVLRQAEEAKENKLWEVMVKPLEYVLSYDPGNLSALTQLSIALRQTGRAMDAGYALKQAVALDPDRPDLWFELGGIAAGLRSEKVAINSYQRALKLRPDHYRAHLGLANVYKRFKQPAYAARHYQRAIDLESHTAAPYRQWGEMAYRLKRYEVCLQVYDLWLKWDGENTTALNGYALALKALGRTEKARETFERALTFAPESLALLNNLGTLLHINWQVKQGGGVFSPRFEAGAG